MPLWGNCCSSLVPEFDVLWQYVVRSLNQKSICLCEFYWDVRVWLAEVPLESSPFMAQTWRSSAEAKAATAWSLSWRQVRRAQHLVRELLQRKKDPGVHDTIASQKERVHVYVYVYTCLLYRWYTLYMYVHTYTYTYQYKHNYEY